MGNSSGKKENDPYQRTLDELFIAISNKKGHILQTDLKKAWSEQIDEDLYRDIESYLFGTNNELSSQIFKKFFFDTCKGSPDQKTDVLCKLLKERDEIPKSKLLKLITNILNSILIIQKSKSPKKYNSWTGRMEQKHVTESMNQYGKYFLSKIHENEQDEYSKDDLNCLLIYLEFFLHMLFSTLFNSEDKHFYTNLLPEWKLGPLDSGKTLEQLSVLNLLKIIFLNLQLPTDCQNKWRLLFSSKVDGESFARLTAQITNQGPTIIILTDKEGYTFGGFASQSWTLGPTFFGDSRSFLFTLYPTMNLFLATNFTDNYQYMNINQQTMPNGLGMGGRLDYFGFWISAEFGKGCCSETCASFRDYKMLSHSKNFEVSHLEVWGVGLPPPTPSELGERSVLDGNLEAKAMLELAGRTTFSDGLREEEQ